MPDFAAISASCPSMTLSAGAAPSRPASIDCGTLRLERCVPSSYITSKRTNSPTIRVPGLRAMLLFLVRGRPRVAARFARNRKKAQPLRIAAPAPPIEAPYRRGSVTSIHRRRYPHPHRLNPPQTRTSLLQILDLRRVVENDVRLRGMLERVILVIGLGREERGLHRAGLGHDRAPERLRRIELRDVVLRDLRLRLALRENLRPILRAGVRALAVELRRVVRHRKEDLQDLPVGHLFRIEGHLHGFGMRGAARADG